MNLESAQRIEVVGLSANKEKALAVVMNVEMDKCIMKVHMPFQRWDVF